jgi:2-keto-3-deoxy-L-rhamnonate aldolase RhmA
MEHGHLGWKDVVGHLRVIQSSPAASIVRVPDLRRESIQRALDIGADAIIVPMIGSREELEAAYRLGKYPPRGVRGVGGERCVRWGLQMLEYVQSANTETMIIPLLETRQAVENIDAILEVQGLEGIWFGPADMSASFGHLGEWEGGPVASSIERMRAVAQRQGIVSGILARDVHEALARRAQGFQWIAIGADVNLMIASIRRTLDALRSGEGSTHG